MSRSRYLSGGGGRGVITAVGSSVAQVITERAHVEAGNQPKLRRLLEWDMVKEMEECAMEWGVGGRIVKIGLALKCVSRIWALELFAEDGDGKLTMYVA